MDQPLDLRSLLQQFKNRELARGWRTRKDQIEKIDRLLIAMRRKAAEEDFILTERVRIKAGEKQCR